MTKHVLMSVKDTAVQAYDRPFCTPRVEAGVRAVRDAIAGASEHPVSKHPEDYELYEIGVFDDSTGVITPHDAPRLAARCKDLLGVKQ